MRNSWALTVFLSLFLAIVALADPVTLQALMADRPAYDGKVITVTGTVKSYFEKEDFSSCLLFDSGKACSLHIVGKAGFANEQKVTVTGTFSQSKMIGTRNYSNVIEVNEVAKP